MSTGNNVASMLFKHIEYEPLIVTHCAPHRLQLAVSDAWRKDEYLKQMEKAIAVLHENIQTHKGCQIDLVFWSDVSGPVT